MRVLPCMLAGALIAVGASCSKHNNDSNTTNATDKNFVTMASYSNKAEIGAGTLASSQGMRDSIKMFGAMMVMDHSAAQSSLDSIASALNLQTPHGPDSLHQATIHQLMSMQGYMFDTAYIHGQVMDHQATISLFNDELSNGKNQLIRNFAAKTLPKIQMHYEMATDISKSE